MPPATADEMRRLGEYVADHVNRATGPVAVGIPTDGLDNYFRSGSQWHGIDVTPLLDALRAGPDPSVEIVDRHTNIDDPEFADAVHELFMKQWARRSELTAAAAG
ncbi:Tm-1-like ATP-binding domain-containing protein [Pseudonocardia sp. NPDC046786]|uniref:Tm-1-like ATP-binding domain-containing protein n=1 Tax=Pseudonocardia sp. NPDC046786 TaxID=3155471 RepID=UPI0033DE11EB